MIVERDEAKRRRNLDGHGVALAEAALIFRNPTVETKNTRTDHGERRVRALGRVGGDTFMVAYTWRGGARRIIGAWRVNDDGRRRYEAILSRRP